MSPLEKKIQFLSQMAYTEVAQLARRSNSAILPIGATEAHGPHIPIDTDNIIASETARRAAAKLLSEGIEALVLPLIPFGVTFSTACFAGTLVITPETLTSLVCDLCLSVIKNGFDNICITNHHFAREHFAAIKKAIEMIKVRRGVEVKFPDMRFPAWKKDEPREFKEGALHAGSFETSLVQVVDDSLIRKEELIRLKPLWINLYKLREAGARNFLEAGGHMCYFGDPAAATAQEGEYVYDTMAEMVAEALRPAARENQTF